MKYRFILFFIFLCKVSYSQCDEKLLTGTFENVKYILRCPTFSYSYLNNNKKELDILNHNNIEFVKDDFLSIELFIKDYILNITDSYFIENLNFYSFEIVDLSRVEDFKHRMPSIDLEKCNAKYSIYFYFEPIENVKYCVGFAIDEKMKVLNKINFPEGEIKPFEKTSICEIKKIGIKYLNTEVENLALIVYNNKFYWSLDQKTDYKQGKNNINNLLIETSDLNNSLVLKKEVFVDF